VAAQNQKITYLHHFIYTKTNTFNSSKIFDSIATKSAFRQASSQVLSKVERAQSLPLRQAQGKL